MKWIKLSDDDFELFDKDIDCECDEYMQSHLQQWQQMHLEQGQSFWLRFLITYRSFAWKCGFASELRNDETFPFCSNKLRRLIDEACVTVHKKFIEGQFSNAKMLFNDIVTIIRNKHLILYLSSGSPKQNSRFYCNETKKACKRLFGDLNRKGAIWLIPFYVKFAGAVYNIFKIWFQEESSENTQHKSLYWLPPLEWNDSNYEPGIFEHYLFIYWDKKLTDILNTDNICELFSREIYKDSCYLEDTRNFCMFCMCESKTLVDDDDDAAADTEIKNIQTKLINKLVLSKPCKCPKRKKVKGPCCPNFAEFSSNIFNIFEHLDKLELTKERLCKKLGDKKAKVNESENVNGDNLKIKLPKKVEKRYKKEMKKTKICDEYYIESETEHKANLNLSNSIPLTNFEENSEILTMKDTLLFDEKCNLVSEQTNVTNIDKFPTHNVFKNTICSDENVFNKKEGKVHKSIQVQETNNLSQCSKTFQSKSGLDCDYEITYDDEVEANISKDNFHTSKERNDFSNKATSSDIDDEIDEFSKDLEDINDNLDTIEKSIKDNGGLDIEGFKLFLETGRLLMKSNSSKNKIQLNKNVQDVKHETSKLRVCAQCMTKEPIPKLYKKCSRCKSEKFLVPRYYCSKKCQVEDWEESHRDEHQRAVKL
ncbi:uncharacterized protein LOC111622769 [Centruroides sculpturatus]|uniref:uncharacterized protein LOC111622769 n=1 Tax=Centruroides sculpturatus TaxID=218467 RepID=UPI000C6E71BD|nr:uncharacterized protein LOC111622769 [Centruroides sculpturatus]